MPATQEQDAVLQLLLGRPHQEETEEQRKLEAFLDRLLLRIYTSTSLIVYLNDARVVDEEIQLEFHELPPEVIPKVVQIIGVDGVQPVSYKDDSSHAYTGFKFEVEDKYLEPL